MEVPMPPRHAEAPRMATVQQSSLRRFPDTLHRSDFFAHPTSLVESTAIGAGTRIWAFCHILPGATVGANCNLGDHCYVEGGATVGDNVVVKNHVALWTGVTLEDGVFVGPNVTFTNDL